MKKDIGDRITKIRTENIGNPNITQRPSMAPKSKPIATFVEVSPITRRETPIISPTGNDDESTIFDKWVM